MTPAGRPSYRRPVSESAYVYGYPLLLSDRAARNTNRLFVGPVHANIRRVSGWLDLGAEPWVLSLPDTTGRYSVIWLRDAWHSAFASLGARTTGTGARGFAILGPARSGMRLRPGLSPIAAPTRLVRVTGCVEAATAADAEVAEGLRLVPLSRWSSLDDGAAPLPVDGADRADAAAVEAVESLDAYDALSEVLRLSQDTPPEPGDRTLLAQVRELVAGGPSETLDHGVRAGRDAVRRAAATAAGSSDGAWRVGDDLGRYGTDYLRRAAAARNGLGAEPAIDELAAVVYADADGRRLTGGAHYVLRFPEGAVPPVTGFWSLSTAAGSISDLHGLVLDPDGALSIRIEPQAPNGRAANWLPAPAGDFALELRLYWPREEALEGRWSPPPVTRVA